LASGRLNVSVQRGASGFVLDTPLASIVDQGTEFGVDLAAGNDGEVHVFSGRVAIQVDGALNMVPEGKAARISLSATGKPVVEPVDLDAERFKRSLPAPRAPERLQELSAARPDSLHRYAFHERNETERSADTLHGF
jgi:hypothetical protein